MKKMIALILSVMLALPVFAFAEQAEIGFGDLAGMEWSFLSGVGAWSTDMRFQEDGSFSGEFHDSEMGEFGKDYPGGTVYCCSFAGRMSLAGQADEYAWKVHVDQLKVNEEVGSEYIDDGIRFVIVEPYGISEGDDMLLYRPGTPVNVLSEDMYLWAHVMDDGEPAEALETWFLMSEKNESGFVGYSFDEAGFANPWIDVTEEELIQTVGVYFGVPDGAGNVVYRVLPDAELAEMQFTIGDDEFCARIQSAALEYGQLMNIADMYFAWENEQAITVQHCYGTIAQAQTGSEDWAELCLWYDLVPGLMYSLSVSTTDPDGLDLTAIAEQVYIPMQGDC
ncbi:MAG: hypothetical protein IKX84_01315 [Clostridia bacterium]|nr:hypothetical protein [Clostridia bacterium]